MNSKLKNILKYVAALIGIVVLYVVIQNLSEQSESRAVDRVALNQVAQIESEYGNPLDPEIQEERGFLNVSDAPITIVEYTDFECPYCSRGYLVLEELQKIYGNKIRIFVKNMPLAMHPLSMPAARRFEALRVRDPKKAHAFYHEIFANQAKLTADGEKYLDDVATKVGGDLTVLKEDMESERVTAIIAEDIAEAQKFEITGTPGFVIDGIAVRGAYPLETFKEIIDRRLLAKTNPSEADTE